jgi:MFS family permease
MIKNESRSEEEMIIPEQIYGSISYQRRLLIIACLVWGFLDIFSLSLGILEMKPIIETKQLNTDSSSSYTRPLTYSNCNEDYTIVYSYPQSLVSYFQISCDRLSVALIASVNFAGVLAGTLISPFIVDTFGRRKPIIFACLFYSIFLFVSVFSPSIGIMLIFIFLCGMTNLVSHIAIFILLNEVTRKDKRASHSAIVFNSFALFGIVFTWELYLIQSWRLVFMITAGCVFVVFILSFFFINESPRYLLLKYINQGMDEKMLKRIFQYEKTLETFHSTKDAENKSTLKMPLLEQTYSDESALCKGYLRELEKTKKVEDQGYSETSKPSVLDKNLVRSPGSPRSPRETSSYKILFLNNNINYIFFIMCFLWFTISGTYYGVLILLKDTKGNIYYVYTIMYLFEIISNVLAAYLMENKYLGRKGSYIFLFFFAIIISILNLFLREQTTMGPILMIALRFTVSTIYSINYVYSTEFYPTDIRAKGFAFNAVCGRLSSIIIPILIELLDQGFFTYCLIVFSISFILSFFLKETHNTELKHFTD